MADVAAGFSRRRPTGDAGIELRDWLNNNRETVAILAVIGFVIAGFYANTSFSFSNRPSYAYTNPNNCGDAESLGNGEVRLYANCGPDFIDYETDAVLKYDFYIESSGNIVGDLPVDQATCEQQYGGDYRETRDGCSLSGSFGNAVILSTSTNLDTVMKNTRFKGNKGDEFGWYSGDCCTQWDGQTSSFEVVLDYDSDDDDVFNPNDACPEQAASTSDGCPVSSPSEPAQDPATEPVDTDGGDTGRQPTAFDQQVFAFFSGLWNWVTGLV